jgi:hypothetical protein
MAALLVDVSMERTTVAMVLASAVIDASHTEYVVPVPSVHDVWRDCEMVGLTQSAHTHECVGYLTH